MSEQLTKEVEKRRLLEDLAENKGYLLLGAYVQEQVDALQQEILFTPCTSVDSAIAQEYNKGKLEGRLAAEALRLSMIESLSINIENLRRYEEDEHDDGSPDANSAP